MNDAKSLLAHKLQDARLQGQNDLYLLFKNSGCFIGFAIFFTEAGFSINSSLHVSYKCHSILSITLLLLNSVFLSKPKLK